MNDYYGELFEHGDPVIAAGWRHRLEQALRYEIALESVDLACLGASDVLELLDVGCGPGGLWDYLQAASGEEVSRIGYTGIDRLEAAVALARARFPAARFFHDNLFAFEKTQASQSFDAVFAIGTMVSGVEVADDAARRRRLIQLVKHSFGLSRGAFCLVVLDQSVVEERFLLRSEPALLGAYADELHAVGRRMGEVYGAHYAVREDFLTTDLALYLWREGTSAPVYLEGTSCWQAHERVLAGGWGGVATELERAWLWMEAGAYSRAEAILNAEPRLVGEHADLMRQRLDFARSQRVG